MLWDELGHEPSFSDFNNDPRTPTANSLAFYFGSYSDAVKMSRHYYEPESRKALEPPPPPPVKPEKKKRKSKSSNGKNTLKRSEPSEAPFSPKAALFTTPALISSKKAPEKLKEPIVQETPEESSIPETPERQTIQEIPEEPPTQEAPKESPALEMPEELIIQEESEEPSITNIPTAQEQPTIQKEVTKMTFISLMREKIALVDEKQFCEAIINGNSPVDLLPSEGVATLMKTEELAESYALPGDHTIAITTVFTLLQLIKNNALYNFPNQRDDVFYVVEREIAEAAREIGRTTDDLVFPCDYKLINNRIYCTKLGKLPS